MIKRILRRTLGARGWMALAASWLAGTAFAAPPLYDVTPVPAWVDVLTGPSEAVPDSDGAEQYLLVDNQVRLDTLERTYRHYMTRIRTVAGVEDNSQVSISFDPKREKLHVHSVTVHRGNQAFDALKTGRIQVLHEERDRRDGILDGELTFTLVMADVRVEDTIDFSYTIERRDAEWADLHYGHHFVQWREPVVHERFRLIRPDAAPLNIAGEGTGTARTWSAGGWQFWELARSNTPGAKREPQVPGWAEDRQAIQYSQFRDWREVAQRALPLYRTAPADEAAAAAAARDLTAGLGTDAQRAVAIVKFVQSQVRYTGIEEGEGAFRPTPPAVVLQRRYGDCKDKALLAVTMLQAVGIPAVPALVSTEWRQALSTRLPSPGTMNHVILRAVIGGRTFWFDATSTAQEGDLEHFTQASFGRALVVAPGVTDLEIVPVPDADRPHIIVEQLFDVRAADGNARVTLTTQHLGSQADALRRRLAARGRTKLSEEYLDYYRGRYPKISLQSPAGFADDPVGNVMTVTESYLIPAALVTDEGLQVMADEVISELELPDTHRSQPYAINYPMNVTQRIRLLMPRAWPVTAETVQVDAAEFAYDSAVSSAGEEVHLSYHYRARQDHVAVERMEGYLKDSHKARDDLYYHVSDDAARPASDHADAGAWFLWALGPLVGLYLLMRFVLPYVAWMRVALGLSLRAPGAEPCDLSDVPAEDLHVVTLLDAHLQPLGFVPLGFLRIAAASYDAQPWEYVRVLTASEAPIDAWVSRRPQPEYGQSVYLSFETRLPDGNILVTAQQIIDPTARRVQILAESHPALSPAELLQRHQARLKVRAGAVSRPGAPDLFDQARYCHRLAGSLREEQRTSGLITTDAQGHDRFTWKGAALQARAMARVLFARRAQARVPREISLADREQRVRADCLAVTHLLREPSDGRFYWPLSAFSMLLAVALLAAFALWADPQSAATLLIAVLVHEAGHVLAMRALGLARAPLLLLPLLAILPKDVPGSATRGQRAIVVAAGPAASLAGALTAFAIQGHWPSPHVLQYATDLTFVTAFSLISAPGSDLSRLTDLAVAPASRWRYVPCVLVPAVLIGLCLMPTSVKATLVVTAVISVPMALLQWKRVHALRLVAGRIAPDADWTTAVHGALDAMTDPRFGRWQSASRQLAAIALADQLMAHRGVARQGLQPAAADSRDG